MRGLVTARRWFGANGGCSLGTGITPKSVWLIAVTQVQFAYLAVGMTGADQVMVVATTALWPVTNTIRPARVRSRHWPRRGASCVRRSGTTADAIVGCQRAHGPSVPGRLWPNERASWGRDCGRPHDGATPLRSTAVVGEHCRPW